MKLSVIIPVYNEERTIHEVVRWVSDAGHAHQIIVVNDGSTDGTADALARLPQSSAAELVILTHARNLGKGAAIRTALPHAEGEIVAIQDADVEYHVEDWPLAIRLIEGGFADAVYGSRFLGPHRAFLFWHYLGNKVLTLLTNALYNTILTDMETGFKFFRAATLASLRLRSDRFDFEAEVTAKLLKRGARVYEIPILYTGRTYAEGKKIGWRDGLVALWTLLKYRLLN